MTIGPKILPFLRPRKAGKVCVLSVIGDHVKSSQIRCPKSILGIELGKEFVFTSSRKQKS